MDCCRLILDVPACLAGHLLCKWLDSKSLLTLDSAMCSHRCRSDFLSLYSACEEGYSYQCLQHLNAPCCQNWIRWVAKRSIRLTELLIFGEKLHADTVAKVLVKSGDRIKTLQVRDMECPEWLMELISTWCCSKLEELWLLSYRLPPRLLHWLCKLNGLRTLHLRDCVHIDVAGIAVEQLIALEISGKMSESAFSAVCSAFPNLQSLKLEVYRLSFFTSDNYEFRAIANLGHSLQLLCLAHQKIPPGDLIYIIERCPSLNSLCIAHCGNMTVPVLEAIGSCLHTLRELHITQDYMLHDAMRSLLERRGAGLESLSICQITRISDGTINAIAEHCINLRSVSLQISSAEPSAALVRLFHKLRSLRSITLRCTMLSKDILLSIADNCVSHLNRLDFTGCALLPRANHSEVEEAMRQLVARAPMLTRLHLSASDTLFSAQLLVGLAKLRPQLHIDNY